MGVHFGKRARRLAVVAVAIVSSLALGACASGGDSGPSASDEPLTKVRVAFNPGTVLQLYAGLAHGLFEKHGLDLELIQFESGAAANAAYASGGVDIGFSGIPGVFAARLASGNTRVFMIDNEGWDAGGLVAGRDSGITGVRDLKGKKIGTVIGTTAWVALMTALEKEGIDPKDVDIQNVGPTAWIPALEKGDVDGIWGWAPLIYTMVDNGGTLVATDSEYQLNPLLWQARGPFIDENPEAIESFIAAYQEATAYVEERDSQFINKMQELSGVEKPMVLKTVDAVRLLDVSDYLSADSPYSFTNDKGLKAILERWMAVLTDNQILQEKPDLNGFIDPSGLQAYEESLGNG